MIIDNPIFTISIPLIAFSITNVFLAWRVRNLQESIEIMHMQLASERGLVKMLIDNNSIKISSSSTQACQ